MQPLSKSSHNILIPRFDTFGDLVLLEGFFDQLRVKFPLADITILTRKGYEQLLPLYPSSLNLQCLSVEGYPYYEPTEQERTVFIEFLDQIAANPWDLVVFTAFNKNWMDNALALKFKDVFKVAIAPEAMIDGWSADNLLVVPVEEKNHETVKYQALLSAITGKSESLPTPKLELNGELQSRAADVIATLGIGDTPYVACVPAGTQNQTGKVWPLERYAELLAWIYKKYGSVPLLLGHKSEQEIIMALATVLEEQSIKTYVWLGESGGIPLLAGLFQHARLYVGNDTGPMHIAAAVGIPVVGIFGGGTFPRFLPTGERSLGVAGELPCFGCYWNCLLGDAPCMRIVTVEDAKEAVRLVLADEPPGTNYLPVIDAGGERLEEFMQRCMLAGRAEGERAAAVLNDESSAMQFSEAFTDCKNSLIAIEASLSWQITKPLRKLADWARRCLK